MPQLLGGVAFGVFSGVVVGLLAAGAAQAQATRSSGQPPSAPSGSGETSPASSTETKESAAKKDRAGAKDTAAPVFAAVTRFKNAWACGDCSATGKQIEKKVTHRGTGTALTEASGREVRVKCKSCQGTGYRDSKSWTSAMDALIKSLVELDAGDARWERAQEATMKELQRFLGADMDALRQMLNVRTDPKLDSNKPPIGQPMLAVGWVVADEPTGDSGKRQFVISTFSEHAWRDSRVYMVRKPDLTNAGIGKFVLIGGILTDVVTRGSARSPVLDGAFVVTKER
jgi:hypothetical protein